MSAAIPIITAVAPALITALAGNKKPTEYTSGLSSQDQSFQNWIRQMIQQQAARGQSPNTMNAQSLLYNRFFGGMPQNMGGQPQGMPQMQRPQQPQQQNFAGALPGLLGQFNQEPYPR